MHAKRFLLSVVVFFAALLAAPGAQAIVINAADYAVGTNLTNAFPGVILQYASYGADGQPVTMSPLVIGIDTDDLSGGVAKFNTFGLTENAGNQNPFETTSTNGYGGWDAIYAAFTVPVYSVAAVGFVEAPIPGIMAAYGADGQLLDVESQNGGPGYQCIPWNNPPYGPYCLQETAETVSSTTPISYVLFAGVQDATYFTEIVIPGIRAPEPSSLALFGGGLFAIGIALSRRRVRQGY